MKATVKQLRPNYGNAVVLEKILQTNGIWMLTVHNGQITEARITEVVPVSPAEPVAELAEQPVSDMPLEGSAAEGDTGEGEKSTRAKASAKKST